MNHLRKVALIADDEEPIQYLLSRQLQQLGYSCVSVSSGQEALDKAARRDFSLMLLDVKMPGMSGLEVLRKFRPHHPETCVVMLTAVVDRAIFDEAVKLGADDFVLKPCRPEYLVMRLHRAHERRELARRGDVDAAQYKLEFREITDGLIGPNNVEWSRPTSSGPGVIPSGRSAGAENTDEDQANTCHHCGQRTELRCVSCQNLLRDGARFCDSCGTAVNETTSAHFRGGGESLAQRNK